MRSINLHKYVVLVMPLSTSVAVHTKGLEVEEEKQIVNTLAGPNAEL